MNETSTAKTTKKPMKNKMLIALAVTLTVLIGAYFAVGNFFFEYAMVREETKVSDPRSPKNTGSDIERANVAKDNLLIDEWEKVVKTEEHTITSEDGLKLWAVEYKAPEESNDWLIAVHGYKSPFGDVLSVTRSFNEKGYNVLAPHMRGNGNSEGDYIGMGWLDRADMLGWIKLITDKNPKANIVLYGKSMGGATVMMTAGEELPDNVSAIIEDCGYTTAYEMFVAQLDFRFGLPPFPIMNAAQTVAQLRAGFDIKEASAVEQLKKCKTPMLFIHGSNDNYVPTAMVHTLYEIPQVKKDILVVEGAEHATSDDVAPELFYSKIWSFLEEVNAEKQK